jgi:hypothetical protein
VTGEEFMELYLGSTKLRQYIVDLVKAYTNDIGRRAHLLYTAWIAVSEAKGDGTMEYYYCVIYSALRREWEKKYLEKHVKKPSASPAIQRVNYKLKKDFIA